jgi:hypothetical protein
MDLSPIYAIGPMASEGMRRDTLYIVTMEAASDSTQPVVFPTDPPQPQVRKRRCFECGAFLSRYNSADYCFIHDVPRVERFTW